MQLDQEIKDQLKQLFSDLNEEIYFHVDQSSHLKQPELLSLLSDVASTNNRIKLLTTELVSDSPRFKLYKNNSYSGVSFKGIPGGHEFNSLILAMLHLIGKGKQPDDLLIERIKKLPSGTKIKTYVSLSCENCPDVVQTLNQMAILHGNLEHEMVDGEYAQDEVKSLNIQGVPSVVVDSKLIQSGKSSLLELLEKLESHFNITSDNQEEKDLGDYDVIVVGGGPAGASAAIYSSRKGLKTILLTERLGGQVKDTLGIENMISIPKTEGNLLASNLELHMKDYPIRVLENRKVSSIDKGRIENLRTIRLSTNEVVRSKSIIIATGAKWRELNVPGEKQYLGRGVAYCPHCDGPFYKNKKVAVVGGGNSGVEAAIDLSNLCKEVVLIEFQDNLKADEVLVKKLKSIPNVRILLSSKTNEVVGNESKVTGLKLLNRLSDEEFFEELDGVFVQIGLIPNSEFVKDLVLRNNFGEIIIDEKNRTSRDGVYAAGDVTTVPYKQIIVALGEGAKAALASFEDGMKL